MALSRSLQEPFEGSLIILGNALTRGVALAYGNLRQVVTLLGREEVVAYGTFSILLGTNATEEAVAHLVLSDGVSIACCSKVPPQRTIHTTIHAYALGIATTHSVLSLGKSLNGSGKEVVDSLSNILLYSIAIKVAQTHLIVRLEMLDSSLAFITNK
jgi:hypothetical protein